VRYHRREGRSKEERNNEKMGKQKYGKIIREKEEKQL